MDQMEGLGIEVASWVREMLEAGNESFYKEEDGQEMVYSPLEKGYEPVREDPMVISLDKLREEGKEVARNDSASLLDLGDGVLCFEIHSKGNAIDGGVLEMGTPGLYNSLKKVSGPGSLSRTRAGTSASGRTCTRLRRRRRLGS